MPKDLSQTTELSPLKRALLAIEDMQAKLEAAEQGRREPIAVIGVGCRIPGGANSADEFWQLLQEGRSGVREIPADRWDVEAYYDPNPEAQGKIITRFGAFLDTVDQFEPQFFGISPREALTMDPQQRLLLEVGWEALEHAGQSPTKLGKTRTGVYFGVAGNDYVQRLREARDPALLDMHFMSGIAHSIASGRLSYFLGLQGPSISVDTACSSSLVAIHLACQGLRNGECRMALAGGVNAILSPDPFVTMSRAGMLAPDGKNKTFDAAADGFVRGEGCGVVVLKRLSDAMADGDRILAVIRGSALNQDGPSSGLTVPNGPSQESVIRDALANAGVSAADVGYVEAHGTGTPLGDPIEVQALGAVFGPGRDVSSPLQIGSLKTNVGHLEAAAGVASLIKVVLSLQHREIPQHLNFSRPSPHIPWQRLPIEVATTRRPWAPLHGRRIAGVSSFGFSGTNAHVVLEEAPVLAPRSAEVKDRPLHLLTLSARTKSALRTLIERTAQRIEASQPDAIADICYTANVGRAQLAHRLAVCGATSDSIAGQLRQFAAGKSTPDLARGLWEGTEQPKIAFLFSGEGSQYAGMGRALYESSTVFKSAIDRCDGALRAEPGRSLVDTLYAATGTNSAPHETPSAQAALFALEYAVCELWRSWGVQPTFALGQGAGEFVAACVAGVFGPEDGLRLLAARAGQMSSFGQAASQVKFSLPQLRMVSNRTGKIATASEIATASYWRKPDQGPGELAGSMETLTSAGCTVFLEVGPNPALIEPGRKLLKTDDALWLTSLRLGGNDWSEMLNSLGRLYVHGVEVDWAEFDRGYSRCKVSLPTYPFERERFMVDPSPAQASRAASVVALHPLAERRFETPSLQDIVFETRLSPSTPSFVEDHRVFGRIIFPAAGYLEAVRAAADLGLGSATWTIEDFAIGEALGLEETEEKRLQIVLSPRDNGTTGFEVWSAAPGAAQAKTVWRLHASGALKRARESAASEQVDIETIQRGAEQLAPEPFYAGYERRGIGFGARFRGVHRIWCRAGSAVGLIEAPPDTSTESARYGIHPALLDACIQVVVAAVYGADQATDADKLFMPLGVESFTLFARPVGKLWSLATLELNAAGAETVRASIRVADERGQLIAEFRGMSFKRAERAMLERAMGKGIDDWIYEIGWEVLPDPREQSSAARTSARETRRWLILADHDGTGQRLAKQLTGRGDSCTLAFARPDKSSANGAPALNATSSDDLDKLISQFAAASAGTPAGVIYLWALDASDVAKLDADGLDREQRDWCGGALHLVQSVARYAGATPPRLWLCTRGAQKVTESDTTSSPIAATVWGLGKVVALEHPELRCARIDLAPGGGGDEIEILSAVLDANDDEDQVALRAGRRWGARLKRANLQTAASVHAGAHLAGSPYHLTFAERGSIENLRIDRTERPAPGRGQVEIRVHATALNFRDVMNVMDLYPGDPGPLGIECSGTIAAVGEGVAGLAVGDEVVAIAPGSFAAYVTTAAELVARKPAHLGFAEAATIPVAFLTADITLNQLARIHTGDRVLIHAAAGGVGLAAVALARRAGAEIFATAGSPEKRALLKSLCVPHVLDSRSVSFADEIMRITEGRGVDVVLNSLAGPLLDRTFDVIARNGLFLEIGKRGIWDPERVRKLDRNIQYFIVDWGADANTNPARVGGWLRPLMAQFERGELEPLPCRTFPVTQAKAAFRFMAHGYHTGKLVLDHQEMWDKAGGASAPLVRPQGTYLIVGGLHGLGLMTAQWLAEKGARHIVLSGRHEPDAESAEVIRGLESKGVQVRVAKADVSNPETMARLLADTRATMPPLRGVVNSAIVLDDGILLQQNWSRFGTVFAAKVTGSLLLDHLTASDPLDFFVMYSSMAATLGAPGQGNYVAANSFMTGLAFARQSMGRPALSVDWGAWSGRGLAVTLGINERTEQTGLGVIDPVGGFAALEAALRSKRASLMVCPADWPKVLSTLLRGDRIPPFFDSVVKAASTRSHDQAAGNGPTPSAIPAKAGGLTERLAAAAPNQRRALVVEQIRQDAGRVLGLKNLELLPNNKPLSDLGLDSVMAIELRNAIRAAIGQNLPATLLFDYPTVDALTNHVCRNVLQLEETPKPAPRAAQPVLAGDDVLQQIEGLDDEEIDRLLKEKEAER
jgi:acyl transferase domain-containing protein/NADPH:quinone reductase-like Zn-dependent oxidoreductase/acyl carrier protein